MKELEAIASKASTLEEFVADERLTRAYLRQAQVFYGKERFPEQDYYAILKQLKLVLKKAPEIAAPLWKKRRPTGSRIKLPLEGSYAKKMNADLWRILLESWFSELLSGVSLPLHPHFSVNPGTLEILESDKSSSEEMKKTAAYATCKGLYQLPPYSLLLCEDREKIASALEEWIRAPHLLLPADSKPVARALSLISSNVRKLADCLRECELSKDPESYRRSMHPDALRPGLYEFAQFSRKFHDLWRGIPMLDCMSQSYLEDCPMPGRWLLPAIAGIESYHLLFKGEYLGWFQTIPLRRGKENWVSLEFWSQAFSWHVAEKSGGVKGIELLSVKVLRALKSRLPERSRGICISSSYFFDNWSTARTLTGEPEWLNGTELGRADEFRLDGSILDRALSVIPRSKTPFGCRNVSLWHAASVGAVTMIEPKISRRPI